MPERKKILSIVGTRPNLVKIAPILRALEGPIEGERLAPASILVHTGQHYDDRLSADLFSDLRLRAPDHHLEVGSGSHAAMTADVMRRLEPILLHERPDLVLVVGDVNSTVAGALTAAKLGMRVAHVEAGLRSFDRSMPEEINRAVTDVLSDYLFTSEESANQNLRREGQAAEKIFFVGNVMIDSLLWALPIAAQSTAPSRLGLGPGEDFALLTVHRPGNVDDAAALGAILDAAAALARDLTVVLPAHPRTRARIAALGLERLTRSHDEPGSPGRVLLTDALGYLDFVCLLSGARLALTDSGGLQEETTVLGVPCVTLRDSTERPVTVSEGTSVLVGANRDRIAAAARAALAAPRPERHLPPLWDGHAAERIVRHLLDVI